jgi:hypothetical protein
VYKGVRMVRMMLETMCTAAETGGHYEISMRVEQARLGNKRRTWKSAAGRQVRPSVKPLLQEEALTRQDPRDHCGMAGLVEAVTPKRGKSSFSEL